jgi:hypothetical protein
MPAARDFLISSVPLGCEQVVRDLPVAVERCGRRPDRD